MCSVAPPERPGQEFSRSRVNQHPSSHHVLPLSTTSDLVNFRHFISCSSKPLHEIHYCPHFMNKKTKYTYTTPTSTPRAFCLAQGVPRHRERSWSHRAFLSHIEPPNPQRAFSLAQKDPWPWQWIWFQHPLGWRSMKVRKQKASEGNHSLGRSSSAGLFFPAFVSFILPEKKPVWMPPTPVYKPWDQLFSKCHMVLTLLKSIYWCQK